nr:MAG TPA: hypothetical protein [Caudoviricetes sp.]
MKLFRNAVFAVKRAKDTKISAFLYVNHKGNISPFWRSELYSDGWSKHGWISGDRYGSLGTEDDDGWISGDRYGSWGTEDDDAHNHWYCVEDDGHEIIMVQSHVTHVNKVNMKLCRKLADRTKS